MSGGSLKYVYQDVETAVHTGELTEEQEELVRDLAGLLHDIEWSASGDYGPQHWRGTLAELTSKWEGGYKNDDE